MGSPSQTLDSSMPNSGTSDIYARCGASTQLLDAFKYQA
jgi:hypothetical protein